MNNFKAAKEIKTGFRKKAPGAQIKKLAEAILLQAVEDLWVDDERPECIDFFSGQEFHFCSKIAGMSSNDKLKMLNMVDDIIHQNPDEESKVRGMRADRSKLYELAQ